MDDQTSSTAPSPLCQNCGGSPVPGELGGFGADGWRCDECLDQAGHIRRVIDMPDLPDRHTAPIAKCQECEDISPLSSDGLCAPCILEHRTPRPQPSARERFYAAMQSVDDPLRHLPQVARIMGCPAGTSAETFLVSLGLAVVSRSGRLVLIPDPDAGARRHPRGVGG